MQPGSDSSTCPDDDSSTCPDDEPHWLVRNASTNDLSCDLRRIFFSHELDMNHRSLNSTTLFFLIKEYFIYILKRTRISYNVEHRQNYTFYHTTM